MSDFQVSSLSARELVQLIAGSEEESFVYTETYQDPLTALVSVSFEYHRDSFPQGIGVSSGLYWPGPTKLFRAAERWRRTMLRAPEGFLQYTKQTFSQVDSIFSLIIEECSQQKHKPTSEALELEIHYYVEWMKRAQQLSKELHSKLSPFHLLMQEQFLLQAFEHPGGLDVPMFKVGIHHRHLATLRDLYFEYPAPHVLQEYVDLSLELSKDPQYRKLYSKVPSPMLVSYWSKLEKLTDRLQAHALLLEAEVG